MIWRRILWFIFVETVRGNICHSHEKVAAAEEEVLYSFSISVLERRLVKDGRFYFHREQQLFSPLIHLIYTVCQWLQVLIT